MEKQTPERPWSDPPLERPRIEGLFQGAARDMILATGEKPDSAHFKATPGRFMRMYIEELFAGYFTDPPDMKVFPAEYKGMVTLTPINIYSACPHHIVPWFGTVHISYVPDTHMAGLSKFVRVARWCAARMICQEDYTDMLVDHIMDKLKPQGAMVVVKMKHMCMGCRGVKAPETFTITDAVRGVYFKKDLSPRDECMRLLAL